MALSTPGAADHLVTMSATVARPLRDRGSTSLRAADRLVTSSATEETVRQPARCDLAKRAQHDSLLGPDRLNCWSPRIDGLSVSTLVASATPEAGQTRIRSTRMDHEPVLRCCTPTQ